MAEFTFLENNRSLRKSIELASKMSCLVDIRHTHTHIKIQ